MAPAYRETGILYQKKLSTILSSFIQVVISLELGLSKASSMLRLIKEGYSIAHENLAIFRVLRSGLWREFVESGFLLSMIRP
jgi:hypothetical protein